MLYFLEYMLINLFQAGLPILLCYSSWTIISIFTCLVLRRRSRYRTVTQLLSQRVIFNNIGIEPMKWPQKSYGDVLQGDCQVWRSLELIENIKCANNEILLKYLQLWNIVASKLKNSLNLTKPFFSIICY